jgi:hypothetical protein
VAWDFILEKGRNFKGMDVVKRAKMCTEELFL